MKKLMTILILIVILLLTGSAGVIGQTPYDSFAPEAWRPMLGDDATLTIDMRNESVSDSVVEFVVFDCLAQQVLLVNGSNQVLDVMQVEEDDVKWLSPDPMADKYPTISPYAYCTWNPIRLIIHRYNNDGKAGAYWDSQTNRWHGRSEGCLLIAPNQWKTFMQQMQNAKSFHLILNRR